MGLWLVQECRRAWERGGKTYDYDELMRAGRGGPAVRQPGQSRRRRRSSCRRACRRRSADYLPQDRAADARRAGAVVRCALESLALRYRWVLERLEELAGKRLDTIHIVGGGCQNTLLCQFTADACNRPVLAGPVEATAIGNVLVQAIGLGLLGSLAEAREVVRRSFEVRTDEPQHPERWEEPYRRLLGNDWLIDCPGASQRRKPPGNEAGLPENAFLQSCRKAEISRSHIMKVADIRDNLANALKRVADGGEAPSRSSVAARPWPSWSIRRTWSFWTRLKTNRTSVRRGKA